MTSVLIKQPTGLISFPLPVQTLSYELIVPKILPFLPQEDVYRLPCVSKTWRQIAPMRLEECTLMLGTQENAEEIAELVVIAFSKGDCFRKNGQRRTEKAEVIADMLRPSNRWYILLHKKEIVGAMLFVSDSVNSASVHMLSVLPEYWGNKYGTILLNQAEKIAKLQGKKNLNLFVANLNLRLIKWYAKHGFVHTGQQSEEYFPPNLQIEFLRPKFQGYESTGVAKLRKYEMKKNLETQQQKAEKGKGKLDKMKEEKKSDSLKLSDQSNY